MTHQTPLDHFCVVDLGNDEVDHILTAVITPEHAPIPTIYQQTLPAPSSPGLTPLVDASPQCWTWFRPSALAAEKKTLGKSSDYENSTAGFPIFHLQESGRQCIQGNFNSECECFLSCAVVGALILCHLLVCNTTSSLCCSESCASPQHPVAVIISTPMDSSTSSHLYSKSQNPKILVTIMLTNLSPNCREWRKGCFPNMQRLG